MADHESNAFICDHEGKMDDIASAERAPQTVNTRKERIAALDALIRWTSIMES